jgi:muramoyltetrapeptide carboxypeptidase
MSHAVSQSILPPRVRPGDTVAIVAPAGPVKPERLRAGLAMLGDRYRLRIAGDIERATAFLAGDDARRADELNAALRDPDVRGIIAARGGYGIMRILERLDADALRRDPVPIVGFSDCTALLSWSERAAGVRGIHGPVVVQLPRLPADQVEWLMRLIEGRAEVATEPHARGLSRAGTPGGERRIEGPLRGGNLCLLSSLCGTRWEVDTRDAIVLLEEVTEKPYGIDRYLTHLALAGAWRGAAGALVGDLIDCVDPTYPDRSAAEVIDERLRASGLRGLCGAPIGHGARNLAFSCGGRVALDLEAGTLTLLEPAVV